MYEKLTLSELFTEQSKISLAIAAIYSTTATPVIEAPAVATPIAIPDVELPSLVGTTATVGEVMAHVSAVTGVPAVPVTASGYVNTAEQPYILSNGKKSKLPPLNEDGTPQLDDEGFPWDARINAQSQGLVNSNLVTGGKAWRLAKGANDPSLVAQVRAEYKPKLDTPPVTTETYIAPTVTAVPETPAVPSAPVAGAVPAVPSAPVTAAQVAATPLPTIPAAPEVPSVDELKKEVIVVINKLVDEYNVEWNDVLDMFKETFKVNDMEGLTIEQYPDVLESTTSLLEKFNQCNTLITAVYAFAGEAYKASVDGGLVTFYEQHNTTELGGVHYQELDALIVKLTDYHKSWADYAASVAK